MSVEVTVLSEDDRIERAAQRLASTQIFNERVHRRAKEIRMAASAQAGSHHMPGDSPLTATDVRRYAETLCDLLRALDREVVETAFIGDREGDLLDTEREEVQRLRELLDRRIGMFLQLDGGRRRGLALLDSFADELKSCADHAAEPTEAVAS